MTTEEQPCLLCEYYKRMIGKANEILEDYDDPEPLIFIEDEARGRECGHGKQEQS